MKCGRALRLPMSARLRGGNFSEFFLAWIFGAANQQQRLKAGRVADPLARHLDISGVDVDPDIAASHAFCVSTGGAGPYERIEHDLAGEMRCCAMAIQTQ